MIIDVLRQCRHLVIITELRSYRHLVITYTLKERNVQRKLIGEKKTFTKSLGGHGPRAPPGYATANVAGYLTAQTHIMWLDTSPHRHT